MSKTNLIRPLVLLSALGLVSAAGCRLSPPKSTLGEGGMIACNEDPELHADSDGGVDPDADVSQVVTPVSCSADNAGSVTLPYVQPYVPDMSLKTTVENTVASMSLSEQILQMQGTLYGDAFHTQFTDIQRSQDALNSGIRGFRYRDASRGMNLGEDMDGASQNAAVVNGEHVGYSTVFPVSMARGAAFDLDLEYAIGEAIGDEMQAAKQTLLLAPCMNLLRHPFWGRAQETYGEDPFHVGRLATALTIGVQQHIAANAKHFMAYDIEVSRDNNNSQLDEQTLRETYARHFRMVVQDGGVASVMASYNQVNGEKSTANAHLLTDVLRTDFGFKGFVLSDWWAMKPKTNAATDANLLKSYAVESVKAGLDVELPWALCFGQLESLVPGQLSPDDISRSAKRVLEQKLRFQADKRTGQVGIGSPSTRFSKSIISCNGPHLALAEKAAIESMVLLKNDNSTLPIPSSVTKLAIVGATVSYETDNGGPIKTGGKVNFATDIRTGDLGSSRGFFDPAKAIGPFDGLCRAAGGMVNGTTCMGSQGVTVTTATNTDSGDLNPVMQAASDADFVVVMAGLTAQDEGEEYTKAADRDNGCNVSNCLALDAKQKGAYADIQNTLIQRVAGLHKPMVVVLEGGSVIDLPWLDMVPAVVMAWYPGQRVGPALSKLLWGQANFSGKLPFTWGKSPDQYDTWNGNGTTKFDYHVGYSWFDFKSRTPLFPFGYGLSYTTFEYRNVQLGCSDMSKGAVLPVVVNVANTGTVAGDEIVMVWVSFGTNPQRPSWSQRPTKELKGFTRVHLAAGQEKQVTIPVRLSDLDYFQTDAAGATTGKWVVESGDITIMVGGSSVNFDPKMTKTVTVKGY
jgi:beta-glucosidase